MLMLILPIFGVSVAVLTSLFGLYFLARQQNRKKKIAVAIKNQYYADSAEKTWDRFQHKNLEQQARYKMEKDGS